MAAAASLRQNSTRRGSFRADADAVARGQLAHDLVVDVLVVDHGDVRARAHGRRRGEDDRVGLLEREVPGGSTRPRRTYARRGVVAAISRRRVPSESLCRRRGRGDVAAASALGIFASWSRRRRETSSQRGSVFRLDAADRPRHDSCFLRWSRYAKPLAWCSSGLATPPRRWRWIAAAAAPSPTGDPAPMSPGTTSTLAFERPRRRCIVAYATTGPTSNFADVQKRNRSDAAHKVTYILKATRSLVTAQIVDERAARIRVARDGDDAREVAPLRQAEDAVEQLQSRCPRCCCRVDGRRDERRDRDLGGDLTGSRRPWIFGYHTGVRRLARPYSRRATSAAPRSRRNSPRRGTCRDVVRRRPSSLTFCSVGVRSPSSSRA